jgi:alanine-synthesizing transaminase
MARAFLIGMFSHRTSWDRTPTQLAERLKHNYAHGEVLLDLTVSNPSRCNLDQPVASIRRALDNSEASVYRPDPRGLREAREAIAEWYRRHDARVEPDDIVLTSGTSEAYAFLFSLLCDAGESVLLPRPGYPLCEFLAQQQGVHGKPYNLTYDGQWFVDWGSAEEGVSSTTKAIVVVHPNNPTGSYVTKNDRSRLLQFSGEHRLSLIADEVFWSYPLMSDRPAPSFVQESEHLTFVLSGVSKVLGLPQLKLSWIIVTGPEELRAEALARLEMMGDLLLSVSMPVQGALPKLLKESDSFVRPILERIRHNLSRAHQLMATVPGLEILPSEGGWSAVLRVPRVRSDEDWAMTLLERHGVLVMPGVQFDLGREGHLIVSLLPEPEVFISGMNAIASEVSQLIRGGEQI